MDVSFFAARILLKRDVLNAARVYPRDDEHDQGPARRTRFATEVSALRSREDRRQRALPPLPQQAAAAHADRRREHPREGRVGRDARAAAGRELLQRPLPVGAELRRREEALAAARRAEAHRTTDHCSLSTFVT